MNVVQERYLLLMPEYVMGGAETQFRYFIEYAEKIRLPLDVLVQNLYESTGHEKFMQDRKRFKNVRLYESQGFGIDRKKLLEDVETFVIEQSLSVRYKSCLIYSMHDLLMAPLFNRIGIAFYYSERVDASEVLMNTEFRKLLYKCDGLFANSVSAKKRIERNTNLSVGLIRNGKPVKKVLDHSKNTEINRILVPARIATEKNQILLLKYVKQVRHFKGKIILAGGVSEKAYYDYLQRFIRVNDLCDKVSMTGHIDDMMEEYRKADLIVLPSFYEGTPNVVLEAFMLGRPVIVSDIEAEKELISNERLRFNPRSHNELNQAINYIASMDNRSYEKMIKDNRKYVLENYNLEKMEASYKRVLTGEFYAKESSNLNK